MKKFLILLYLMIFSISFTAQYKISKRTSVKMTQSEMEKNSVLIEKSVINTFTESGLKNHFSRVEDKKNKNLSDEIYSKFVDETLIILSTNAQITITKIEFLSEKKAEITAKYKTPTIGTNSLPKYDAMFKNEFKRQMGYSFEKIDGKILSNTDKQKIDSIIKDTARKVVKLNLKNAVYSYGESRELMEKVDGKWRFVIK